MFEKSTKITSQNTPKTPPKSTKNQEKNDAKNCIFFDCIFGGILDGFWIGFGGCFGGFFRNLGIFFPICVNIFYFLGSWKEKLLKFTHCGGLEALEEDFGVHFGGYLD